jgi:hypothetical protein
MVFVVEKHILNIPAYGSRQVFAPQIQNHLALRRERTFCLRRHVSNPQYRYSLAIKVIRAGPPGRSKTKIDDANQNAHTGSAKNKNEPKNNLINNLA